MEYDYTEQSNERFYLNLSCQPFIAKNISFGPGFSYNRNISKYPGQKDYWNEYITLSLLTNFYFLNMFYVSPDLSILIYDNSEFEGPEESNTKYLKLSFGKVTQISSNVFLDYGVSFTDRKYKFTNEDGIDVENNSTQKSFYTGLKIIIPSKKK